MKYKVGDLVTLSSAGRKRAGNIRCLTGFGIVTEYVSMQGFPYTCRWFGGSRSSMTIGFKQYEIKKFKAPA